MNDIKITKSIGGITSIRPENLLAAEQQGDEILFELEGSGLDITPGSLRDFFKRVVDEYTNTYGCVTRRWKVYGAEGHRQKESFNSSVCYNFSTDEQPRLIQIYNSDLTGTNDYTEIVITRSAEAYCEAELGGQITDGIFENNRVGDVVEIVEIG